MQQNLCDDHMVGARGDENCQCRAMGKKEKNRQFRWGKSVMRGWYPQCIVSGMSSSRFRQYHRGQHEGNLQTRGDRVGSECHGSLRDVHSIWGISLVHEEIRGA
jgi:hypothetical protein